MREHVFGSDEAIILVSLNDLTVPSAMKNASLTCHERVRKA
jgi:hypothetical protein